MPCRDGPPPRVVPAAAAARLARAERFGIVRRSVLPPPAGSTVYELTETGRALEPAVFELIRWGGRFLFPPRPGERVEPAWIRLALAACARRGPSPSRSVLVRIREGAREGVAHVAGGPEGTAVTGEPAAADATVTAPFHMVLALMAGVVDPLDAAGRGWISATGDPQALQAFPDMFELTPGTVPEEVRRLFAGGDPGRPPAVPAGQAPPAGGAVRRRSEKRVTPRGRKTTGRRRPDR